MENNNQMLRDVAVKHESDDVFNQINKAREATGVDFSSVFLEMLRHDERATDCKGVDVTAALFGHVLKRLDDAVTEFQLPSVGDQHLDKELLKTMCRECPTVLSGRSHFKGTPWQPTPFKEYILNAVVEYYFNNKGESND